MFHAQWNKEEIEWSHRTCPIRVIIFQFSSVHSLSHIRLMVTPWNAACQASLSITNSRNLVKFMSIESVMLSSHLILCHPLLLPPSIFPNIRVFSNESVLRIRWPKYWSFSFSISPSNEYSGLISLRIDWLDFFAVQGTLSRVFFNITVQKHQFFSTLLSLFSNSHIHTWLLEKIIALTIWTFVSKVMSLLFNMLSRLVIRRKFHNFTSTVTICSDFGAQENSLSLFPLFAHLFAWSDRTGCHDVSFLSVEF